MADVNGKDWQRCIAPLSIFSEYILYGLHSARVLGADRSGHWHDPLVHTLCYWRTELLDVPKLEEFKATRQPQHHSAMVSAKSGTSVADIRRVFLS